MIGLVVPSQVVRSFVRFVTSLALICALAFVLLAHMFAQILLQMKFALAATAVKTRRYIRVFAQVM